MPRSFFQSVDGGDVRVIGREELRLALEPAKSIRILGDPFGQHFDRHVALQPRVPRAVDLAHAARANGGEDLVRAETNTG